MRASRQKITVFKRTVWAYYRENKRDFPWRHTREPWAILVSEVMLQQTQVERVVRFYKKFVRKFPTSHSLALARLKTVLRYWSGLGYNRRALALKRAAEKIVREHNGEVPHDLEKLDALPGIGANTAAAILAYAWNEPSVFIETNIRTVFLHHFFPKKKKVGDGEILKVVYSSILQNNGITKEFPIRDWYSALMDYGAHLKKTYGNPNARSAHYAKQTKFAGSARQVRGEILRRALARTLRARDFPSGVLADLVREGFLQKHGNYFILRR